MAKSKTVPQRLLERLLELDLQTQKAYYEMGSILSAIHHGNLCDRLGFESFGQMIDRKLSFSRSTAYGYMHMYRNFQRLGYNKTEALELLSEFGLSDLQHYLAYAMDKVGKRAIRNQIELTKSQRGEITFWIPANKKAKMLRVLREHGCTVHPSGTLGGSSQAFLNLIESEAKRIKPKLKAVS